MSYTPNIIFENDWYLNIENSGTTIDNLTFSATAKSSTPWDGTPIRLFFGIKEYADVDINDGLDENNGWYEVNGTTGVSPDGVITASWTGLSNSVSDISGTGSAGENSPYLVFRTGNSGTGGHDLGMLYFFSLICNHQHFATVNANGTNFSMNSNIYMYFYSSRNSFEYFGYSGNSGVSGNPGINCLLKGTKILTPFGYKLIENLKEGDIILNNNNEERKIKKMYSEKVFVDILNGNRDMYKDKYLLKNSDNLIVSGGHMIKVGDEYHLPINSDLFENIQKETEANHFYHIELDTYDFFIANGVEVESLCREENQSQKEAYYSERGLSFQDLIKSKK